MKQNFQRKKKKSKPLNEPNTKKKLIVCYKCGKVKHHTKNCQLKKNKCFRNK